MNYLKYSDYKDSGIEWLGKIPEHWQVIRLKFLSKERLAYGANEAGLEDNPEYPRFVRITDISQDGTLRTDIFKSLPPDIAFPYLLKPGDILLARSGATVGKTFIYKQEWGKVCFAGYLIRFRCDASKMSPEMLFLFTQSSIYWTQIEESTIQATIQNFSAEKYADVLIPFPPLHEQYAIVDFLDRETTRLDALIAAKERVLVLLTEKRRALITQAVTRGLDLDVPMQVGIDWLASMPAHWKVIKLKYIANISYGLGDELDKGLTSGIPLISLPNVALDGTLDLTELGWANISLPKDENLLLRKGDLLFNWRNGSSDHLAKTAYFDKDGLFTHVGFLLRIRFDLALYEPKFFQNYLYALRITGFFLYARAMVNNTFNQTELANLYVILPPLEEQKEIAKHIETETKKLDALKAATERTISLLKERRASLIAAAVTGQIAVGEQV